MKEMTKTDEKRGNELSNKNNKLSVFISLVLRHKPEAANVKLDEFGYVSVEDLIKGVNATGRSMDFETLLAIVNEDQKKRYSFDESMKMIRANQGHSVDVKIPFKELTPPAFLYHGTAQTSLQSILSTGLNKRNRLFVHLSENEETALQVGKRHGVPIILTIDAGRMHKDGHRFYLSENHVWQVEFVPNTYISN